MNELSKYREGNRLLDGASTGGQRPPSIAIKDNRFALVDPSGERTPVNSLTIDVVFVDRNPRMSKLFWGRKYPGDGAAFSPPVCFSDNGLAPSSLAQAPQAALCANCPHNVVGSAVGFKGGGIKACQDLKKTAVVVIGHPGIYELQIKPGSFKNWNNFHNFLRMQKMPDGGVPDLSDIVTQISFVSVGVMDFKPIAFVEGNAELVQRVISIWEHNKTSDITGMMVGNYDKPATGVLGPAQTARPAAPPPPEPQSPFLSGRDPGAALFPQQPLAQASLPQQPAAEEPKRARGRPKKDEPATAQPQAPVVPAQYGMQMPQQAAPPSEVAQRLDSVWNLPTLK
jgi:hypothetical protein